MRRLLALCPLFLLVLGALLLAGCPEPPVEEPAAGEPLPTAAAGTPDDERAGYEVAEAHLALIDAYQAGDVEAFVALLDPGAELLLFHPRTENRFDTVDEVREVMPQMFDRLGPSVWTDVHCMVSVNGKVAWLTADFLLESDRLPQPFVGRSTEIWRRTARAWRLVHAHWSQNPQQRTTS